MTDAEYQYQLEQELSYLRNEIREYIGGEEINALTAVETARKLIHQHLEQQVISDGAKTILDNINKELESLKFDLEGYCKVVDLKPPVKNTTLTEAMQLAKKIIAVYHAKCEQMAREIRQVQENLQVLAESESHCTQNKWHMSKDGIIQALTLRLCGESRDRLRRLSKEGYTIGFRSDEF